MWHLYKCHTWWCWYLSRLIEQQLWKHIWQQLSLWPQQCYSTWITGYLGQKKEIEHLVKLHTLESLENPYYLNVLPLILQYTIWVLIFIHQILKISSLSVKNKNFENEDFTFWGDGEFVKIFRMTEDKQSWDNIFYIITGYIYVPWGNNIHIVADIHVYSLCTPVILSPLSKHWSSTHYGHVIRLHWCL